MTGWRWRLVALLAALAPTVLTLLTQPRAGSYAGFVDRPVDPGLVTEINAWYAWQTVVGLAVPAMVVGLAWLCRGRARRPATTVAAALLAFCALAAVPGALARDALPPPLPSAPTAVAWLYVPFFAASAAALWFGRRPPADAHP